MILQDPLTWTLAMAANRTPESARAGGPRRRVWRQRLSAGGAQLDALVDALMVQRDRINRERLALLAGTFSGLGFLGVGELQTRADSMLALLDRIDAWVGESLPRLEQRARQGEAGAEQRAITATSRILEAVGGVSPASDLIDDVRKTVDDIADDSLDVGKIIIASAVIITVGNIISRLI